MPENKHTEFKLKVTPELEKEVVAFLNSNEGGVIYIDKTWDWKRGKTNPNKSVCSQENTEHDTE